MFWSLQTFYFAFKRSSHFRFTDVLDTKYKVYSLVRQNIQIYIYYINWQDWKFKYTIPSVRFSLIQLISSFCFHPIKIQDLVSSRIKIQPSCPHKKTSERLQVYQITKHNKNYKEQTQRLNSTANQTEYIYIYR